MEGVSSELGPLEYLSGLLDRPMDQIINWFILIIIFVFDPLAVALVIAFNNAVMVDRGIVDKQKVIRKRELYDEEPEDDDSDNEWEEDEEIQDFLERADEQGPWSEEDDKIHTVGGLTNDKEQSFNEFQKKQDEFDERDLDKDGIVSEEEKRKDYEVNWKNAFEGRPYYIHPWFDWKKSERWINDREAINYWMNHRGGSSTALSEYQEKTKYPDNFDKKTY
jgi:hypothetical protein